MFVLDTDTMELYEQKALPKPESKVMQDAPKETKCPPSFDKIMRDLFDELMFGE